MTVKQLRKELKAMPTNSNVVFYVADQETSWEVDVVKLNKKSKWVFLESEEQR